MTERVWPPHRFAAPLVVDHRRSPPPFLFLFHQHIILGVNRPTLCSSSQTDADAALFTSEMADVPPFRAERSGFVGKALRAEPWEVK